MPEEKTVKTDRIIILVVLLALSLLAVGNGAPVGVATAQDQPPVKAPAFVSTPAGGNWSALATWQTQDGRPPRRVPGDGDTVTISGPVTVEVPVTVGTGTGDAIVLARSGACGSSLPRGRLEVDPEVVHAFVLSEVEFPAGARGGRAEVITVLSRIEYRCGHAQVSQRLLPGVIAEHMADVFLQPGCTEHASIVAHG